MNTAPLTAKAYADNESQESKLICGAVSGKWAKGTGGPSGDECQNLVTDILEHARFHYLTCDRWFGVNDYEERIVTCPSCGETHIDKITDVLDRDVAATLNSGGNSGGFRSEPGEHLVLFDERNITSKENRSNPQPGDPCHTLHALPPTVTAYRTSGNCGVTEQGDKVAALNTATDPNQTIIAFSSKDHGADAGEISPTLRAQEFRDSHMNGGGQVAIAFEPRYYTRDNKTGGAPNEVTGITNAHKAGDSAPVIAFRACGQDGFTPSEVCPPVSSTDGGGANAPTVCFESCIARNGRGAPSKLVPPLKTESGQTGKGDGAPLAAGEFGVRRLTPMECERLQSFPDLWTATDSEGKTISDSARYRMLGNAVCVNVAYWIGKRIITTQLQCLEKP